MQALRAGVGLALCAGLLAACGPDPAAEYAEAMALLSASPAEATLHLRRAAEGGSSRAAFRLGQLLRRGANGVAPEPAIAFAYMRQAAQAKLPQAEFLLGQMLLAGEGTPRDPAQARHWLEEAAEHDLPEANLELALAGQRGELGITREEAQRYLMEAGHASRHRPPEP